jgi:hypothetical protein
MGNSLNNYLKAYAALEAYITATEQMGLIDLNEYMHLSLFVLKLDILVFSCKALNAALHFGYNVSPQDMYVSQLKWEVSVMRSIFQQLPIPLPKLPPLFGPQFVHLVHLFFQLQSICRLLALGLDEGPLAQS